jgi:hypothetical protein
MLPHVAPYHEPLLRTFLADPIAAHLYFFPHRHPDRSPSFHAEVIRDVHDLAIPKYLAMTFRGGAKSTLLEEAMILLSMYRVIKNGIIIGESETRAAERLNAVKYEIANNERLYKFFGVTPAEPWTSTRALLSNGTYLQAYGRGQSLRGAKHLDNRPDFAFLDDIESEDSVNTEEAITKTMRWVTATLFPAMAKDYYVRMAATPLHPNAACVQLSKDKSFKTRIVPVYYYDTQGKLTSAWEERNPLEKMLQKKDEYERLGMAREFGQEYLCEAETVQTKAFDVTALPVDTSLLHTFQPTFVTIDPARTAKSASALTGYTCGSWEGQTLTLWEADGAMLRPDGIIDLIFKLDERFNPVFIAIDKTGLEEFIMQPLRYEMAKRGRLLPVVPAKNPRNKLDFIRSLQPFISAGEIKLCKPMPQLQTQLLNFPSGKIDTLNALAYLLQLHPGEPVYQNFSHLDHIVASPLAELPRNWPVVYCLNSSATETAGAVITLLRRKIAVLADAVVEGAPVSSGIQCLDALRLQAGLTGRVILPKKHFARYETLGLRASLMVAKEAPGMGADPQKGRVDVQERLDTRRLEVSSDATFTLRALTCGYAYDKDSREPRKNFYATLMEAIESAVPVLRYDSDREDGNYAYTPEGKRYLTSRVR